MTFFFFFFKEKFLLGTKNTSILQASHTHTHTHTHTHVNTAGFLPLEGKSWQKKYKIRKASLPDTLTSLPLSLPLTHEDERKQLLDNCFASALLLLYYCLLLLYYCFTTALLLLTYRHPQESAQRQLPPLFLPLEEQLKRLIPDFTPATSAPASDRSHYERKVKCA